MKYYLVHCFIIVVLLNGCVGKEPLQTQIMAQKVGQAGNQSNVQAHSNQFCRVAVLPFANLTREDQAGIMAQRIFHGALVNSKHFKVHPEGDIHLFLLRHRLLPGELLESFHFGDLHEKLQIDAVVQGRLTKVGMDVGRGGGNIPVAAMEMNLYDVRDGQLILSTIHHRRGDEYRKAMHFGTVTTMTGLLDRMSDEIIADWIKKGVGNCQ